MNNIELAVGAVESLLGVALGQVVSEKRAQRAERLLARLASTDKERNALIERVAGNEAFEALMTAAVTSAMAADAEHRVAALAAMVRRGLECDDAVISAVRRAERAIHDMDAVELRMLLVIAGGPGPTVPSPTNPSVMVAGGIDVSGLRHAIEGPAGIHESVTARLVALGLIEDCAIGTLGYEPRWAVTEFGLEVLVFLQADEQAGL